MRYLPSEEGSGIAGMAVIIVIVFGVAAAFLFASQIQAIYGQVGGAITP